MIRSIVLIITLSFSLSIMADESPVDSVAINFNDGPYVFWQNDTTALVLYLCNDIVDSQLFMANDTIRFPGLCDDSELIYKLPVKHHNINPSVYSNISKIVAVSDIHGDYEPFVDILIKSGVINANNEWIFGDGHLVIDGDIFDRGDGVTETLWLIYKLEQEATANGGAVHFILGNHELMVLGNDLRYVNDKYTNGIVKYSERGCNDLYGRDTEMGRWLRACPTALKINDILFVHGGLSTAMMERGYAIDKLNDAIYNNIDQYENRKTADSTVRFLFGSLGPFWYRGYHYEMEDYYPQISLAGIDSLLDYYQVKTIVVGHTEIDSVTALYDNKIIGIDVPCDELGGFQSLLWENGQFYKINVDGSKEPLN